MKLRFAAALLTSHAWAQTVTFAPQPERYLQRENPSLTVWAVTLCSPSEVRLPVGQLYRTMVDHGIVPLAYQPAVDSLTIPKRRGLRDLLRGIVTRRFDPRSSGLLALIPHDADWLQVTSQGCATVILLGSSGGAFNVGAASGAKP